MLRKLRNKLWQEIITAIIILLIIPGFILIGIKATGLKAFESIAAFQLIAGFFFFISIKPLVVSYYRSKQAEDCLTVFRSTKELNKETDEIIEDDLRDYGDNKRSGYKL